MGNGAESRNGPGLDARQRETPPSGPAADTELDRLHALGLAARDLGDIDRSADAFEQAIGLAGDDPAFLPSLLVDYSAVLRERAAKRDRPLDLVLSLSAAERAAELRPPDPSICVNRAEALDALFLHEPAVASWRECLSLDLPATKASAIRRRLDAGDGPGEPAWDTLRERLTASPLRIEDDELDTIVMRYAQPARQLVRENLLAQWATALESHREDEASDRLELARRIAASLRRVTGDAFESVSVAAIDRAAAGPPDTPAMASLSEAHRLYGEAKRRLDGFETKAAAGLLEEAARGFDTAGSPFSDLCLYQLGVVAFYQRDLGSARNRLEELARRMKLEGRSSLCGSARLMIGLIDVIGSKYGPALRSYEEALACYEEAREGENALYTRHLIAEVFNYLGERDEEWRRRYGLLASLAGVGDSRQLQTILTETSIAAAEQGYPRVAIDLQRMVLDSAERRSDPVEIASARLWYARILDQLGRAQPALVALNEAESWLDRVGDENLRGRLRADLLSVRGGALARDDAPAGIEDLREAVALFRKSGDELPLPGLYLSLGRALARSGNPAAAEQSFLEGVSVFERQREAVSDQQQRISLFDQARDLFDELVDLTFDRDPGTAWGYAERGRARDLLDRIERSGERGEAGPLEFSGMQRDLQDDVALVYYSVLPDRTLAWVVTARAASTVEIPLPETSLDRMRRELLGAIEREVVRGQFRDSSMALHDTLVRPIERALPAGDALVIVPDKQLHTVPFAALISRESGHYLVEEREISIAPSASLFLRPMNPTASDARVTSNTPGAKNHDAGADGAGTLDVLVVGDPEIGSRAAPGLGALGGARLEAGRIAHLYPHSVLLTGAEATKARFLDLGAHAEVIHFAGHALTNDEAPASSRLLLAHDAATVEEGDLYAADLYGASFERTKLVVLAACSTASGRVSVGEGPLSLARPFLASGAGSVLASLWDVPDAASATLLTRFHQGVSAGLEVSVALRSAQLSTIRDTAAAQGSPRVWAAFELIVANKGDREREGKP